MATVREIIIKAVDSGFLAPNRLKELIVRVNTCKGDGMNAVIYLI